MIEKENFFEMTVAKQNQFLKDASTIDKKKFFTSLTIEECQTFFLKQNNDQTYRIIQNRIQYLSYLPISKRLKILSKVSSSHKLFFYKQIDPYTIRKIQKKKNTWMNMHPKDMANEFEKMDEKERFNFYHFLDAKNLSHVFEELEEEDAASYITELSKEKARDVIENLDVDDAVDIIKELEEEDQTKYLSLVSDETKEELTTLSQYTEDEAASLMDTNFISLDGMMDVKEAMKVLFVEAKEASVVHTLFVSLDHQFLGVLDIKKLIVTKSPCFIKDITDVHCKRVDVHDSIEKVISFVDDYDIYALPVLKEGVIEGIITIDDALRALHETREEEYNQLAGLSGEHEAKETIKAKVKKRISWLFILCLLDILVCLVIASFENMIEKATVLVLFQPIVLGLAGNVGTQSLAVCVRQLSSQKIETKKKKFFYILKEFRNGFSLGLLLGIISFMVVALYLWISNKSGDKSLFMIAGIVSFSIFVSMSFSSLFGSLIPIFFSTLSIDPAAASGPFMTTLNDMIAICIYFLLATFLLL